MHHTGSLDSIPPPPGYPFDQSPNSSPAVPVLTGISPARPLCAGSSHTGSATARRRCSTFAPLAVLFVTVETGSRKVLTKAFEDSVSKLVVAHHVRRQRPTDGHVHEHAASLGTNPNRATR